MQLIAGRPWPSVRSLTGINGIGRGRIRDILEQELACVGVRAPRGQRETIEGMATVLDGDTFEVAGVRVRLEGLHCPEGNEPGGSAATSAMRGLAACQHVNCLLTGQRSYNRMIGTCYVGDTDLTAAIILQGVCARCPRYYPGGRYLPARREAGPWRGSMPGYC